MARCKSGVCSLNNTQIRKPRHSAANAANLGLQAATGATAGGLVGGIPGSIVGGLAGLAKGTYENVAAHRARKKAEDMAKKTIKGSTPSTLTAPSGNSNEWWNGKGEKVTQVPLLSPEQIASNAALRPGVLQQLLSGYDFGPQEARSRANFAKYTRPGIAEMFKAHGGGANSDAYENALGVAQAEHESGLDILRNEHGFRQQQLAQNLFSQLQQPQHQNLYSPATSGLKGGLLESVPGLLNTAASYGVPALFNWASQPRQTPTSLPQGAQTIGASSTPAGQAVNNIAAATAPVNQLGGSKTGAQLISQGVRPTGFTNAGRAIGGVGLGLAGLAATNWIVNQLRGGQQ